MGLLQKAATAAPSRGLFRRSVELLRVKGSPSPLLTQGEIDELLAHRPGGKTRPRETVKRGPAHVPLTWSDAGVEPPPVLGPSINPSEFGKLFRDPAPAHQNGRALSLAVELVAEKPAGGELAGHDTPPHPDESAPREAAVPGPAAADATTAAAAPDPEALAEAAVTRILALPANAQFPSEAFSILQDSLSISKGALLLYDPLRMVYAPWASKGYDTTTHRRLRIPLGAADSFNAAANGEPIAISGGPAIGEYQKYFSTREFGLVSRILLAPFISEGKLSAILMVTDASPPFPLEDQILSCLSAICRGAAAAVLKAREERLREAASPAAAEGEPAGLARELPRLLAYPRSAGRPTLLFSLGLTSYLQGVSGSNPYVDPFRLEEDLRYFLELYFSDVGKVIQTQPGIYLAAVQELERRDLDLFMHQLRTFLRTQFGDPAGGAGLREASVRLTRSYPDEEPNIPALVSFFSS